MFWPFAFGDIFSFAFWPYYDPFWNYGPDFIFASLFWPYGAMITPTIGLTTVLVTSTPAIDGIIRPTPPKPKAQLILLRPAAALHPV